MLLTNKYAWIGAGVGVLVVAYLTKKAANALVDTGTKIGHAINPLNDDNIFNQGATDLYQWMSGSEGSIGGDIWDYLHKAEPAPGGGGGLINYTPEQEAKDKDAIRRLENGYHGM